MTPSKIFKKSKNIIIGAIHFPPLFGYADFPGLDIALKNALEDLKSFEDGGVDGIIIENNYDIPHRIKVNQKTIAMMMYLGKKIKQETNIPIGVSVLWNDYCAALSIAKKLNFQFIRVPVFVDKVKTSYGIVEGKAKKVIDFRKSIGAKNVAIFTDIHVKHAKLLSKHNLIASAELAIKNKSDAIIITGKWTGIAPNVNEIKSLRKKVGAFPVLIGSGVNIRNIKKLFKHTSGAIVSTSLKEGKSKKGEVNIKSYQQRISYKKVRDLIKTI